MMKLSVLTSTVWCVFSMVFCQLQAINHGEDMQHRLVGINHLDTLTHNQVNKRATIKPKKNLWPAGRIPYILDPDFSEEKTRNIHEAMQNWENRTCIRFVQREPDDQDYVYFEEHHSRCETKTGRTRGKQITYLGACARNVGNIMHELGHIIGFYHEQNRPDRDKYIKVLVDNIDASKLPNYRKYSRSETRTIGFAYDYESIMHYSNNAFSNGNGPTFKIKKIASGFNFTVGQRRRVSDLDVAQVREMYKCNKLSVNDTCITNNGFNYRGTLDYTVSGVTCQRWSSNWPHSHQLFTQTNVNDKGLGDHNYCRNPDGRERPWCFTTKKKPTWQYCDLKNC
ncbi:zinc metalloproteinase nas-7-like isoform X2 [Anneissia japonica]|uniref:zinc metalloproteinase nas-7-like isoform X2 n=1 Tax=Anneissia japonica TaxID=1529436 RepID=UPI00142570AF|nr:zinc metalloproteinase nas-7-like isoform X2 [Anneissia japonica]